MQLKDRIIAFANLGRVIQQYTSGDKHILPGYKQILDKAIEQSRVQNPWFTSENIQLALSGIAHILKQDLLENWLSEYHLPEKTENSKNIGVISAGNLPLVGFHDMLCVLITGHHYIGKLSGKDQELLKALTTILTNINTGFNGKIEFTEELLHGFDAIIATGSNNTGRYFDYYFGKYPNIIRKNRNSVAVLTGKESQKDMQLLADDIFQYFGLGCRNVSMLYLPEGYDIPQLIDNFAGYSFVINHHKYANNYEYNKAVYLVNRVPHFDSGFVLLREDAKLSSPLGVIHYQYYHDLNTLMNNLKAYSGEIQCVVGSADIKETVPFGKAQMPELWDYADGVDTIRFLKDLKG
jgi:hypothetical protein